MPEKAGKKPKTQPPKKKKSEIKKLFHMGSIDVIFCCIVFLLFAFGLVMMYSASYAFAAAQEGSPNAYLKKQLYFGILGIVAMFVVSFVDYRIFNSWVTPFVIMPVSLLLLLAAFIQNRGSSIKRWLSLGPIGFQPSEVAKLALILVMAYMICILSQTLEAKKGQKVIAKRSGLTKFEKGLYYFIDAPWKASLLLLMVIGVFAAFVVMGKHLSGTILIFLIGMSMLWLGGVPKRYFAGLGAFIAAVVVVVMLKPDLLKLFSDYAYERIMVWKSKEAFGSTTYWQTEQGLLAIGSGGFFGLGLGNSRQKLLYVPEPQNDFIFTIVCEELGVIGAAAVILLFAVLIIRGFMIAVRVKDYFGSLLVCGIMMQIGLQVLLNIAVVTDSIPNTGISLPFFSYGGTSLFILFLEMGLVLSVSRKSYIEKI